jgi:lysophospholipase L1-like esterase
MLQGLRPVLLSRLADVNVTTEAYDPHCLRPGQAESLLAGVPWRRLAVLGDSIAAHPGDPVDGYLNRTWADRLAAALRPAGYVNLGVIGVRAAAVRAEQLETALEFRPDLAVVAAGANDALRRSFDPPAAEAELEHIVGRLSRAGATVLTFGCFDVGRTAMLPPEQRVGLSQRLRTLARITKEVCRRHGGVHVDFADHPAQTGGVLSSDLLHINVRGHAVVAADVIRALARRAAP